MGTIYDTFLSLVDESCHEKRIVRNKAANPDVEEIRKVCIGHSVVVRGVSKPNSNAIRRKGDIACIGAE